MNTLVFQLDKKIKSFTHQLDTLESIKYKKLSRYIIEKGKTSIKKYCEVNNYDYICCTDSFMLRPGYYGSLNMVSLERYMLASVVAQQNYEKIIILDYDVVCISTEPLPYTPGFSAIYFKDYELDTIYDYVKLSYLNDYHFNTSFTLWLPDVLHKFCYWVQDNLSTKTLPILSCVNLDETFIANFFYQNKNNIIFENIDKRFLNNYKEELDPKTNFIHIGGNFKTKVQRYKKLPKEIRDKILQ